MLAQKQAQEGILADLELVERYVNHETEELSWVDWGKDYAAVAVTHEGEIFIGVAGGDWYQFDSFTSAIEFIAWMIRRS